MAQNTPGNPFPTAASQAGRSTPSAGTPNATATISDGTVPANGAAPQAGSAAGMDATAKKEPMIGAAAALASQVHDSRANKAPPPHGADPEYDARASGGASGAGQSGLGEEADRFVELARDTVSKNPLASVAVAVAVGLLLARL